MNHICDKCPSNLPKKNVLICLICGIKICCVEKAKQHNLLFFNHRLSLEISINTLYCHTCQKEFSYDEFTNVSIHGRYVKERCKHILQQLSIYPDHPLPSDLEEWVKQLTEERNQLREGYSQLEKQIDQLTQERDQLRKRCTQLEQQVTQINQQLKERCGESEKQVTELSQQHTKLKQIYNELENQKNELSKKNSSLSEQQKVHTEIAQQRETQIKEQLKEDKELMAEMHQQLNQMQHSLYIYRQQLYQKNSLITTSQLRYQTLENKLHEADKQNGILKKQNDNLESENLKLNKELSEILATLTEMRLSSQQKEEELSKLRLQLEHLLRHNPAPSSKIDAQRKQLFITLLDYYPKSFCQSGHPEQELQLRAGDVVNVIGKMNSDGYYYVQFNDRRGLVPAHFLEEMNIKDPAIKQRLRNQSLSRHARHSSSTNEDSRRSSINSGDMNTNSNRQMSYDSSDDEVFSPQSVAPPTELRVECVSQNGLTVSWTLPNITSLSDSIGLKIKGYVILLNDTIRSIALGPCETKASIKNINVDKPHSIAIATLTVNGTLSSICQTQYQPKHTPHDHHNTMTESSHHHEPSHSSHNQLVNVTQSPKPMSGQQISQEDDII